jgi:MYXO-CTERM domain-containing protein
MNAIRISTCALLATATLSNAALLVYEGFNYADGNLTGGNGGIGWNGAWGNVANPAGTASGSNVITSGVYFGGDATGANTANSVIFRDLATEYGTDGTTIWISVQMQRLGLLDTPGGAPDGVAPDVNGGGTSWVRPQNWALFDVTSTTAQSERLSFGEGTRTANDTDTFGLLVGGSATNAATVWSAAPVANLNTALVRIQYGAGNVDTATLWMNPAPGDPALLTPSASTTGNFTFDRVRPFAGNRSNQTIDGVSAARNAAYGSFDEFMIGSDWSDVHPVPEPGTVVLAGLAGLALLRRRR